MRLTFLPFVYVFLCLCLNAKSGNIDVQNNNALEKCNNNFWKYLYEKPDSAFFYAKKGLSLTSKHDCLNLAKFNNNIGIYFYYTDLFDSAFIYYQRSLNFSILGSDSAQQAKCYNNMAIIYDMQGEYSNAIEYYNKALYLHQSLKNYQNVAECYNNIAVVEKLQGELNKALNNHEKSIAIHDSLNNIEGLAYNYNNIGLILFEKGDYTEALLAYKKSLRYFHEIDTPTEEANVVLNIANVYQKNGMIELALKKYNEAINTYSKVEQGNGVAICLINIAKLQHQNNDDEIAIQNIKKAIDIFKKIGFKEKTFEAIVNFANIEISRNKFLKADSLLCEAILIANKLNSPNDIALVNFLYGNLYLKMSLIDKSIDSFNKAMAVFNELQLKDKMGETDLQLARCYLKLNNINKSLLLAKSGLQKGEESGNIYLQKESTKFLYELFLSKNDYKKALDYKNEYHVFNDSLNNVENAKKITAFQLKMDNERQLNEEKLLADKKVSVLKAEIKYQRRIRNILVVSFIVLSMLLVSILNLLRIKNRAYSKLVNKNYEISRSLLEISKLKAKKREKNQIQKLDLNEKLLDKIVCYIEEDKRYLSSNLKLTDLSNDLNTNTSYISQVINMKFNKNFNQFINDYRIREACQLFERGIHHEKTIEGIALTVGFNNRATFISAFKNYTGVTPSFYIKSLN